MPTPSNKQLYNKVKREAKRKFKVWPSAYASAWLVKEYKRRGGKYKGRKPRSSGLDRWFDEKWINVCKLPKKVKCGRPKTSLGSWKKKYPYCRPSVKVNSKTPKTYKEFSKAQLKKRCSVKRKSPRKKVTSKRMGKKRSKKSKRRRRS
jgi:hypothetical protein